MRMTWPLQEGQDVAAGTLILRLANGIGLLAHGPLLKLAITGMAQQETIFAQLGFSPWLAWYVLATETVAGALLLLGCASRWAAAAALPVLLGATYAHLPNGWLFAFPGGGWEFPAFWSAALAAQVLLGDGAVALKPGFSLAKAFGLRPSHSLRS